VKVTAKVDAKMIAPDLIASTPVAKYVSGPRTPKKDENTTGIFAEGATIEIAATVENIGTAASPATKATWRGTEGITSLTKVADFGKLEPIEEVAALGMKKGTGSSLCTSRNARIARIC